jgi:hypothetical protein
LRAALVFHESFCASVTVKRRFYGAAQQFITRAGFVEERFARAWLAFESRMIQPFDLFSAITPHHCSPLN